MDMLAAEGYLVGMYTGKYFSTQLPISTICAKYEIWIAHYLGSGTGYEHCEEESLQSDHGDVAGINLAS